MVSIPDWTKFSRLAESQKVNSQAILNKYYKQQEQTVIRQAEESGYFLEPDGQYLLQHMGPLSGTSKDLARLFLIRLPALHIRKLGDIPLCSSLQICILPNNYITKIDPLSSCQQIVKLDLHGNQLTAVPGPSFWSALRKLRALYLHDNPLGKFETLQSLSAAPTLSILTLFDTPLCLKQDYRHHVVNSVWTLQALDQHVISDEEIIEDAIFGGHFSALSPFFKLDLCPVSPTDASYHEESNTLKNLEAEINTILAKHSPVIIVQRYIRGYLTRKRLGLVKSKKSQTHAGQVQDMHKVPPAVSVPRLVLQSSHPMLKKGSEAGVVPPPPPTPLGASEIEMGAGAVSDRLNLTINMTKLQTGTLQLLVDEAETLELHHTILCSHREPCDKDRKKLHMKTAEKQQRIKSIKHFFGPMVEIKPSDNKYDDDTDQPVTKFRLHGHRPNLILSDPTTELVLSRMEAGRQIRDAELERAEKLHHQPPPTVQLHNFSTNGQRLFARVYGNMGLSCLMAVQKAYKDREKAEQATAKMEYIMTMREERQRAKEKIQMFQQEKQSQALRKRDMDRLRLLEQLEKKQLSHLNYLSQKQEEKGRASQLSRTLYEDSAFMNEFSNHHTSVSKALLRHDRQARFEETISAKKEKVSDLRMTELEQQETVKKYLHHRQAMRQTETAVARAALDTRILQETTERLMLARQRVAHVKAMEASVQAYYPLSSITAAPITASAPAGLTHMERSSIAQAGKGNRLSTVKTLT